jgi:hypothetical protein
MIRSYIVGAYFRPPAPQVLSALPSGHALVLVPEPGNEFDPHALRVMLNTHELAPGTRDNMSHALEGTGYDVDELDTLVHLGYVASTRNKLLTGRTDVMSNEQIIAALAGHEAPWTSTLMFDTSGRPQVVIAS